MLHQGREMPNTLRDDQDGQLSRVTTSGLNSAVELTFLAPHVTMQQPRKPRVAGARARVPGGSPS
jgi:hypothetical protein